MLYETEIMDLKRAQLFDIWFSKNIGAELEINTINDDVNQIYFVCGDLSPADINKLVVWEHENQEGNNA